MKLRTSPSRLLAPAAFAAASFVVLVSVTSATAQPRDEEDYLFLTEKSVHIASGATIHGNVGVQSDRGKAKVGLESVMASGTTVVANKINLAGSATVSDVYANKLRFKPTDTTINGTLVWPIPPPLYDTELLVSPNPFDPANYPAAWPVTCGAISHEVLAGQTLVLSPGQYQKITVREGGHLTFAPGTFELCDLRIMGAVDATGAVEINIQKSFTILQDGSFQPAGAATPSDIQINMEGKKTIRFGDNSIVSLRLYAPKATLKIRAGAVLTGHFVNRKMGCSSRFTASPAVAPAVCGDGSINSPGETCEPPGSTQANGAICRGDCTYCGDGATDASEQCDDGNSNDNDTCRNDCTLSSTCGDGTVNAPGETCEPPGSTQGNGNVCRVDCTYCGDGNVDGGEQCDDGNSNDSDGCANDCTFNAFCGDGSVNAPGETCDPPGSTESNGNTCQVDCTYCGDGNVDAGETCDDGNTNDNDGCRNDCTSTSAAIDICKQEEGPDVRNITYGGGVTGIPIANGGFEQPSAGTCSVQSSDPVPGWVTSNSNQYTWLGVKNGEDGCSIEAPEGDQFLKLTEVTIEQVIGTVTEATTCDLAFWVNRGASNTTEWVKVFAGSTELIEVGPGSSPGSWVERTGSFTIPASLIGESIKIEIDQWAAQSSDYSYYDDIRVECGTNSAPEVEFEIKVKNIGDVALTNVVVDDPLVAACDLNIGNLAVGATETYTCSASIPVTAMAWLDEFGSASYGNNDGDTSFAGPWVEVDGEGGGATGGNVLVSGGRLQLDDNPDTGGFPSATRAADLSGKDVAILSFDFWISDGIDSDDSAAVQVSSDGSNFTTLEEFTGYSSAADGSRSYDISAWISAQTTIRFVILHTYGASDETFKVDDVSIVATSLGQLVNEACASGDGGGTIVNDCDTSTVIVDPPTPTCGDGLINQPSETCEPPGSMPTCGWCWDRVCRNDCTFCGDGNVDPGEQCDDANEDDYDMCTNNCMMVGGD